MAKRVPIDQLSASVEKILAKYQEDVQGNVNEIVKEMSRKGAQTVRKQASSMFGGTGEYAPGWTSKAETGRISAQGVIYNATVPGLPHLLEHGHALRQGGRAQGRPHIAPVEEALVREFEQKVKSKL